MAALLDGQEALEQRCKACPRVLVRSRSGYCVACFNKHRWTPEARQRASDGARRRWERDLQDPEMRARVSNWGREMRRTFPVKPETVARAIAGRRRSHWLPEGYDELNRGLRKAGFKLAERQAMIADQVAKDALRAGAEEQARVAALSPFERQLELVRNGARVIDKPSFRPIDPIRTLGGVSSGML